MPCMNQHVSIYPTTLAKIDPSHTSLLWALDYSLARLPSPTNNYCTWIIIPPLLLLYMQPIPPPYFMHWFLCMPSTTHNLPSNRPITTSYTYTTTTNINPWRYGNPTKTSTTIWEIVQNVLVNQLFWLDIPLHGLWHSSTLFRGH